MADDAFSDRPWTVIHLIPWMLAVNCMVRCIIRRHCTGNAPSAESSHRLEHARESQSAGPCRWSNSSWCCSSPWRSSPISLGGFTLANGVSLKEVRVMSSPLSPTDDIVAFPTLDEVELNVLETLGSPRSMTVGEYLYQEGDTTYDFYALRSGAVEIVVRTDGEERLIVRHG